MKELSCLLFSFFRNIRGVFDRVRWLFMDVLVFIISTVSTIFFVNDLLNIDYSNKLDKVVLLTLYISAVSFLIFLSQLTKFLVQMRIKIMYESQGESIFQLIHKNTEYKFNEREAVYSFYDEKGAELFKILHPENLEQPILFDEYVNKNMQKFKNAISLNKKVFELHPIIHKYLPFFMLKMKGASLDTFDEKKVRLSSDITPALLKNQKRIELQKTSYFRDRLSNGLANFKVTCDGRMLLNLRDEVIDGRKRLLPLHKSRMSNQLGGSVILIAEDSIVLLKQGNRTDENPTKLSPSGSGSFDYCSLEKAVSNKINFQEFCRKEVLRELCEECGLEREDVFAMHICGYGRSLYRNGKPEIFCIARTKKMSFDIAPPLREWDYQQKEPVIVSFNGRNVDKIATIDKLEELLNGFKTGVEEYHNYCGPLYWNVFFAIKYLQSIGKAEEDELFA